MLIKAILILISLAFISWAFIAAEKMKKKEYKAPILKGPFYLAKVDGRFEILD